MARIAESLRGLVRRAAESDHRRRRIELDARWQLHNREEDFTRKLRRVEDRAITDPLTGLRNRTFLDMELEPIFRDHCSRRRDLSVVMMDIDDFKLHNDTHGHSAGDEVLRFIGGLLRSSLRPTDRAVRYGGDEFLLLLPATSAEQAAFVVDRLVKLFGQYASMIEGPVRLSLSAGVASISSDPVENGNALAKKADEALYAAKRAAKAESMSRTLR
jgi:diguanylate cyclase (GGDEF)-like protein